MTLLDDQETRSWIVQVVKITMMSIHAFKLCCIEFASMLVCLCYSISEIVI